jgi:uncharacterized protein (TIGR03382 family)
MAYRYTGDPRIDGGCHRPEPHLRGLLFRDFVEALLRFKESQKTVPGPDMPDEEEDGGCAAAPGGSMAVAGLMLWVLRSRRRSRTGA